jgi:hypothetical protein
LNERGRDGARSFKIASLLLQLGRGITVVDPDEGLAHSAQEDVVFLVGNHLLEGTDVGRGFFEMVANDAVAIFRRLTGAMRR